MADVAVNVINAVRDDDTAVAFTSLSAGDNAVITYDCKDESTVILFLGGAADAVATFKAGEGIQGVKDIDFTIPDAEYVAVPINSGKFKNTYGDLKGKVVIAVDKACSIAVVQAVK